MTSTRKFLAAAALATAVTGCAHGPRHVTDINPSDKIPAIRKAAADNDRSAIPELVKDLDSDDPAVRLYAIKGLRVLTGNDFGYCYYQETDARKPAVDRWKQWLASQSAR